MQEEGNFTSDRATDNPSYLLGNFI